MSSVGRLLTPFTQVLWGDIDLSAWEYSVDEIRPVVYDAQFSLQAGDNKVNNASFLFDPSPVGFSAYSLCVSEENLTKPIKIRFGYENGDFIETVYFFQDVDFVTGKDQSIRVNLAGLHKQAMSASWWSEYIGDGTSEFDLKELWDVVVSKIGYEMVWSQAALTKLNDVPKIRKAAVVREPIGTYLVRTAEEYGFYLQWPTGSEADHKKVIVEVGALDERKRESLKVIEKYKSGGKTKQGSERIDERQAFILGPTLVAAVTRKTKPLKSSTTDAPDTAYAIRTGATQDLDAGQLYSGSNRNPSQSSGGSSKSSSEALASQRSNEIGSLSKAAKKTAEQIASESGVVAGVQPLASNTAVEQALGVQAQNKPPGTNAPSGKDTTIAVDDNGKKLTGEALKQEQKKKQDAKNTKKVNEYSECSCDVFMVPYMVGIQPKDFVVFPSLSTDNPYVEDWEVKSVSYKQQGAAVLVSVSGVRPKPGADPLILDADLKKLQERVKSLTTPEEWNKYYWSVK